MIDKTKCFNNFNQLNFNKLNIIFKTEFKQIMSDLKQNLNKIKNKLFFTSA